MGELTYEIVEEYGDKLFGNEDGYLFKLDSSDMYTLDEKFDTICKDAFLDLSLQDVSNGIIKINFNKVTKIEGEAFWDEYTGDGLEFYFDADGFIEICSKAFSKPLKILSISGLSKEVKLKLYKESFVIDDTFFGDLQKLEKLSLYLEGPDWTGKDIKDLQGKIQGNVPIFKDGKEVKDEKVSNKSDTEEKEAKTEEKVEIEKEVKTEEGTKAEENKYKAWEEIEDKTKKGMIDFVISKLVEDEFRIKADIDIDKAIEADGEIKLPKECFVDIKLVSAGGGIVEVLKLLSKPGSNEENILLTDNVDNRKLAKDATKEYIKGHWDKVIKTGIEYNVKIVKGNVEEKIKDEGARKKFLDENNAGNEGVKGVDDVKEYIYDIATKKVEEINQQDIKNIIKNVSIIAKESKKEDKKLYDLCKTCVGYMRKAMTNKGE